MDWSSLTSVPHDKFFVDLGIIADYQHCTIQDLKEYQSHVFEMGDPLVDVKNPEGLTKNQTSEKISIARGLFMADDRGTTTGRGL